MAVLVTLPAETVASVKAEALAIVSHGRKHKTEKYGAQKDRQATRLERNENGFGAEEAACSYLSLERTQRGIVVSDFKHDLADRVEVRTTTYKTGRLIVHPDDPNDVPFVFAIGRLPTFNLVGWCWGYEAKKELYWATPPEVQYPAFFMPSGDLRPIEDLLDLVHPDEGREAQQQEALVQAVAERDAIEQRWKDIDQWPRPWTSPSSRDAWVKERVHGLLDSARAVALP